MQIDCAHEDVCGPAIAHLLRCAYTVYADPRYERLAELSDLRKLTPAWPFLTVLRSPYRDMEGGNGEKWTAEVNLQPTILSPTGR